MLQDLVQFVRTTVQFLLELALDGLCLSLLLCSLTAVWRVPAVLRQAAEDDGNGFRWRLRQLGVTQFCYTLFDWVAVVHLLPTLLTWRCYDLLLNLWEWWGQEPGYNHNLRWQCIVQFWLAVLDVPFVVMALCILPCPWEAVLFFLEARRRSRQHERHQDNLTPSFRPLIWKYFCHTVFDVLLLPIALVLLLTGYRLPRVLAEARGPWRDGELFQCKAIVFYHFLGLVALDVPAALCGIVVALTLWRTRALLEDLQAAAGESDAWRGVCLRHFGGLLFDLPFMALFVALLPTGFYFVRLARTLARRTRGTADPTPQLDRVELRPEPPTCVEGKCPRLFLTASKPPGLAFQSSYLHLDDAANRGLWHRLGLLGYYPTILRAFLPLKLCPKYVCAGDFVAGSATVATVVKLPMSRHTFYDVLSKLERSNPIVQLEVRYGSGQGTLLAVRFTVQAYLAAAREQRPLAYSLPPQAGAGPRPTTRLCDVFRREVAAEVMELLLDVVAVFGLLLVTANPFRAWWVWSRFRNGEEAFRLRRVAKCLASTLLEASRHPWLYGNLVCRLEGKAKQIALQLPTRAAIDRRHEQQYERHLSTLNSLALQLQAQGEASMAEWVREIGALHFGLLKEQCRCLDRLLRALLPACEPAHSLPRLEHAIQCGHRGKHMHLKAAEGALLSLPLCLGEEEEEKEGASEEDEAAQLSRRMAALEAAVTARRAAILAELDAARGERSAAAAALGWFGAAEWSKSRRVILLGLQQAVYDCLAVGCALVIVLSCYRLRPFVASLQRSPDRRGQCFKYCGAIVVDGWYLVQVVLIMACVRYFLHLPVDLIRTAVQGGTLKQLRKVVDQYRDALFADFFWFASGMCKMRVWRFALSSVVWGFCCPCFVLDSLPSSPADEPRAKWLSVGACLLLLGWLYGTPAAVCGALLPAGHLLEAWQLFLSTQLGWLGLVLGCAVVYPVAAGAEERYRAAPTHLAARSWSSMVAFASVAFEFLVVWLLLQPDAANPLLRLAAAVPEEAAIQASLLCVGLHYVVVSLCEVMTWEPELPPGAWAPFVFLGSITGDALFVPTLACLLHYLSPTFAGSSGLRPYTLWASLAVSFFVPTASHKGAAYLRAERAMADVHFAGCLNAFLHLCLALLVAVRTLPALRSDAAAWMTVAAALLALVIGGPQACSVPCVGRLRRLSYAALLVVASRPFMAAEWVRSLLAAVVCTELGLALRSSLQKDERRASLMLSMDGLQSALLRLEERVWAAGDFCAPWAERRQLWVARVASARRVDLLAALLLKVEKHVRLRGLTPLFVSTRRAWLLELAALEPCTGLSVHLPADPTAEAPLERLNVALHQLANALRVPP